jgi:hypothetical protein
MAPDISAVILLDDPPNGRRKVAPTLPAHSETRETAARAVLRNFKPMPASPTRRRILRSYMLL